jgi:quinol monooxygenase YgiN
MTSSQHVYEVRPRKDHRGVDLISDALPFGRRTTQSRGLIQVRLKIKQRYDFHSWIAKQLQRDHNMTTKALFVKLEAKPGKENEVAKFLREAQGLVQQEPTTTAWFGIRLGSTTFAIFDAFADDAGREAHLSGKVAKALMEKAPELLAEPPKIEKADVLADRLLG